MFKLQKHKSHPKSPKDNDKDKVEFKFTDLQAIKVPKGWDKLFVYLVSVETGKTSVKSVKTSVRNGTCTWTDVFTESIYVSQHYQDSNLLGPCFYKFVVAMGSSRSGILGEVSLDLANFANTTTSTPLSFSLKKCQFGTSLQFRVQCLTPQTKCRAVQKNEANVDSEYVTSDHDDMESRSDAYDGAFSTSIGSTSSSHFESVSISQAALSRDPSFSDSDSHHSKDLLETSSTKDVFSPQKHFPGAVDIGGQDSTDSQISGPSCSFRTVNDGNLLLKSSFHYKVSESPNLNGNEKERNHNAIALSPLSNIGSSKEFLEATEVTMEELRAEVRMWERNSKKLSVDVDLLKNEVSQQSISQKTLSMELSASQLECYGFQQEIEHLKGLLEMSAKKQETKENKKICGMDMEEIKKKMEEEIHLLKELNEDLTGQLEKTQESNIELLSILQELEGIVETQKLEIVSLSSQKLKLQESVNFGGSKDLELCDSNLNIINVTRPMDDPDEQIPLGIDSIKLQLQQLQDTQEELESAIKLLEKTVEEKDDEIERLQVLREQALLESDSTWSLKVAAKEEHIVNLEAKLASAVKNCQNNVDDETQLVKEIDYLRRKVDDLEKDCNELTEENLKLILKLQELNPSQARKDMSMVDDLVSSSHCDDSFPCTCGSEMTYLKVQLQDLQQELRRKEALIEEAVSSAKTQGECPDLENQCSWLEIQLETCKQNNSHLQDDIQKFHVQVKDLQTEIHALQQQLKQCKGNETKTGDPDLGVAKCAKDDTEEQSNQELGYLETYAICNSNKGPGKSGTGVNSDLTKYVSSASEVEALKSDNLGKEEEIRGFLKKISTLEDQIAAAHDETRLLVESVENLEREKVISSEIIEELKREIIELSSSVESHASASTKFQRQSSELEKGKQDVEHQLSEIEKENMQMSERMIALEAQLRDLTNKKETCYLELRYSEAQLVSLREEIRLLETKMHAQKVDLKQRLEDMRAQWLEVQEECEYLKKANPKLQSTAENLIEECHSLQKLNGELKRQNMEMNTCCTVLESQVRDSKGRFFECSQKIDALEAEFCNILEEVSLKEKGLNSELDSLIIEDKVQKEKLMHEHISLNDMYSQKVFEVEILQRELVHLIDQISVADDEKGTQKSHSILEPSVLHADKAKLESSLLELQEKFALCRSKLHTIESEYEAKVQDLSRELTTSRRNEEVLMADYDNLAVQLESVKNNTGKYKSAISVLEINLNASEYERQQLDKEISTLKDQLQRATLIQDELLVVKTSLSDAKYEHERMKASLEMVRGDYDELKADKDFLIQKVSNMEKTLLELENCQRSEIALQEKVLRLEGDLAAREALSSQDTELKFELSRIRRINNELQRKINYLEQDQEKFLHRIHALEEHLKQIQTAQDLGNPYDPVGAVVAVVPSPSNICKEQLEHITGSESTDDLLKVQSLRYQLAEALEENNMYKAKFRRCLTEEQLNPSESLHTPGGDSRSDFEIHGRNVSSLEIELRDLRERYFEMSLKYAEVEAQREELVLKLKSRNNRRGWFSK